MVLRLLMTVFLMGSVFSTSKVFSMTWEEAGFDLWKSRIDEITHPPLKQQVETFIRDESRQLDEELGSPLTKLGSMVADERGKRKALSQADSPEKEELEKALSKLAPIITAMIYNRYSQIQSSIRSGLMRLTGMQLLTGNL